ncbi:MAG: hypothetical protein ACM3JC_17570 [Rudaea sp.]
MTGAQRALARFAAVALALVVGACASLVLRDPPRIDVVGVALDRVEGPDAYFTVRVRLTNRVVDDLEIESLTGTLSIEGERVAQAALASAPVRLPGNGSAEADMTARTGMDAVLRAIANAMRSGATILAPGARPALHYAIEGSARLAYGLRVPFRHAGEIGESAH